MEVLEVAGKRIGFYISSKYSPEQSSFYTDESSSLQLGIMKYKAGGQVAPHFHQEQKKEVYQSQEIILIRNGSGLIKFFEGGEEILEKKLESGDLIFIESDISHSLETEDGAEIYLIKQGPYSPKSS